MENRVLLPKSTMQFFGMHTPKKSQRKTWLCIPTLKAHALGDMLGSSVAFFKILSNQFYTYCVNREYKTEPAAKH